VSLILLSTDRFVEHDTPPGHPERPERAEVMDAIAARWRERGGEVVAPRAATHEQLLRVHDADYVRRISDTAGQATALDADTYTSPDSYEIALLAAGGAVDAIERVMDGRHRSALALVRPPGHHAEHARAMGFCLFNNVAIAAAHARALGAARVAIVDFDVHHGNGTQHAFEADASVLYVSTHQYPYYPGTGAADEVGVGDGAGFTVNLPLEAGAASDDYRIVFDEIIGPVVRQFQPEALLISAGFDAHEQDPLAMMRLTTQSFAAMTSSLREMADDCCDGRIALVTEGGYHLHAFAASLDLVVQTLAAPPSAPKWPATDVPPTRGRAAVAAARRALGRFWQL